MEELNQNFSEYFSEFEKLNTDEKKEEVLNSIKEIIVIIEKIADIDNIPVQHLKYKESTDFLNSNSLDDYLKSELFYIEDAKNLIGQYLNKKI